MRTPRPAQVCRALAAPVALAAVGFWTLPAARADSARARPRHLPAATLARSIGSPTDGALIGGVPLEPRADLRLRWPDGPRWALPELVSMLERAARRVHRRYPGSILLVGDLSREGGGALSGHVSHESGRDADVAFYYHDGAGRPVRTARLLPVKPSGAVSLADGLRFDPARNWALVEAFLTDPGVVVQRIFVSEAVKRLLIDHARQEGVSARLIGRAHRAMRQPLRGHPHDDHFHVRVACPKQRASASACVPASRANEIEAMANGAESAEPERTASLDAPRR